MTDQQRTTSIGLARYGCEFLEAAIAIEEHVFDLKKSNLKGRGPIAAVPVMYLVGHSIELLLKSFLLKHGVSLAELRSKKYGHDLIASLDKSKELGIGKVVSFDSKDEAVIKILNIHYSKKELEYIVTGTKTHPIYGLLESAALKLAWGVSKEVGYRNINLPAPIY